jgi:hypothetical protein
MCAVQIRHSFITSYSAMSTFSIARTFLQCAHPAEWRHHYRCSTFLTWQFWMAETILWNGLISRGKHFAIYRFGTNSRCFIFVLEVANIPASCFLILIVVSTGWLSSEIFGNWSRCVVTAIHPTDWVDAVTVYWLHNRATRDSVSCDHIFESDLSIVTPILIFAGYLFSR